MYERMTESARNAVVCSQGEAIALNHNYIGTEHLLLGLLQEGEGLAARALRAYDITVDKVRDDVIRLIGKGNEEVKDIQVPFTPRSKKVLELGLREALSLGHNYIATEHILLAIVREDGGVASQILRERDITPDLIRMQIIQLLSKPNLTEPIAVVEARKPSSMASLKQQALENIEDALGELSDAEFLLFVGWLEGVAHSEQAVALAVRGES